MNRRDFLRGAATLGFTGASALAGAPGASALTVGGVEGSLRCYCGCGKVLAMCDCEYADNGRAFVREKIQEGLSKDEVIDAYVAQFTMDRAPNGPQNYPLRATVSKEGRGLSLWLIPPIGVIVGASLVYYFLKQDLGSKKGGGASASSSMDCGECGASVPSGSKFCTECGSEVGASFCRSCGESATPGDAFCSNCGEVL